MDVSPGSIEDVPRVAALYRATDACVRAKENDLGVVHSEPQAYFGAQVDNLGVPGAPPLTARLQ